MIGRKRELICAQALIDVHLDHLAWLEGEFAKFFPGRTFVVTHHAPQPDVVGQIDNLSAGFASNFENFHPTSPAGRMVVRAHAPTSRSYHRQITYSKRLPRISVAGATACAGCNCPSWANNWPPFWANVKGSVFPFEFGAVSSEIGDWHPTKQTQGLLSS